jgi:hypothetical protein
MTTVINNPGGSEVRGNANESGGSGVVIGAVIVVLVLVGGIILALPYIKGRVDGMTKPTNPTINVTLPAPTIPSAQTQ